MPGSIEIPLIIVSIGIQMVFLQIVYDFIRMHRYNNSILFLFAFMISEGIMFIFGSLILVATLQFDYPVEVIKVSILQLVLGGLRIS